MELLTHSLPEDCDIILWSDTHYGTSACSIGTVKEIVHRISQPRTYCIHGGDFIEGKLVDSPHFSHEVHSAKSTPVRQMAEFCDLVRPIKKDRWLGIHRGNHEMRHMKTCDLGKMAAENLGIPHAGFLAKHIVKSKKTGLLMFRAMTMHGSKIANSTSPDPMIRRKIMLGQIKNSLSTMGFADCVLQACAHGHKLLVAEPAHEPYFSDNGSELVGKYTKADHTAEWIDPALRWYGMMGSQMRTLVMGAMTYGEASNFGPASLGYLEVMVRAGRIAKINEIHLGHC